MTRRLASLCVIALIASGGVAQSVADRLKDRIPASAVAAVDSMVKVAVASGLPGEPLVQKALEGSAKGATSDRIIAAVVAKVSELRSAQVLLQRVNAERTPAPAEIVGVAAALGRRLPPELAERVATALPGEPPGPAMHAVADLVGHGIAEDSAVDLVVDAANAGVRGSRLLDVAAATVQELQRGRSHADALSAVRAALPGVPRPPQPSRNTLIRARRPG